MLFITAPKGNVFDPIQDLKKNREALVMMENDKVRKVQYRADYIFANRHITDYVLFGMDREIFGKE